MNPIESANGYDRLLCFKIMQIVVYFHFFENFEPKI